MTMLEYFLWICSLLQIAKMEKINNPQDQDYLVKSIRGDELDENVHLFLHQMSFCCMIQIKFQTMIIEKSECHYLQGNHFFIFLFFSSFLQSIIARKMLESQLRRLGVFNAEETISRHPNLDESIKSCQYAFLPR